MLYGELIKIGAHREAVVKVWARAGGCVHSGGDGGELWGVSGYSSEGGGRAVQWVGSGLRGREASRTLRSSLRAVSGWRCQGLLRQSGVYTRFKWKLLLDVEWACHIGQ